MVYLVVMVSLGPLSAEICPLKIQYEWNITLAFLTNKMGYCGTKFLSVVTNTEQENCK